MITTVSLSLTINTTSIEPCLRPTAQEIEEYMNHSVGSLTSVFHQNRDLLNDKKFLQE